MNSQIRKESRKKILKTLQHGVGGEGASPSWGKRYNVMFVLFCGQLLCHVKKKWEGQKNCIPFSIVYQSPGSFNI